MCNTFFADCREHSTPYYNLLEILNFDNIVKFKTAVFTLKILKKKETPAIFSDFIIGTVDIHSHKTRYTIYPRKFFLNAHSNRLRQIYV